MTMNLVVETKKELEESLERKYMKGVRHLCESGITRVPSMYIFPIPDRCDTNERRRRNTNLNLELPVIDLALLLTPERSIVLNSLARACEEYGFFRVMNHGIPCDVTQSMISAGERFFELPFEERSKYMSTDIRAPVRYGTSFNQMNDGVLCWRDFLKLNCHPLAHVLPYWPSSPLELREGAISYAKQTKSLFLVLMGAILETLGVNNSIVSEFKDGTHLMVVNCYPECPEPNLTLGMPPHSDYGFLTLLLQDDIEGLQVQCGGEWVTIKPVSNSLVINIGDHLEIFSNGRYKSVLHRVLVNSSKSRISVASLHSLQFDSVVSPSPELINDENSRRYKDTDFTAFLDYLSSRESKHKNFLESRKLNRRE